MLKKGYGLVRYADDFCRDVQDKQEAEQAVPICANVPQGEARARTARPVSQQEKTQIRRYTDGFQFVGFLSATASRCPRKAKGRYKERSKGILGQIRQRPW